MSDPILIVGGGPVGMGLALALQQQAIPVKVLEARQQGASYQDKRALALSYGTKLILETLGVWQTVQMHTTVIQTIHISQRGGLGRTLLKASEHNLPALGYVVSYGALMQALGGALNHVDVQYETPVRAIRYDAHGAEVDTLIAEKSQTINSHLVVVADGGRSLEDIPGISREGKAYGHDALVSKVSCELPHNNVAYERFTPTGPMALLPNGPRDFSLVWTGKKEQIDRLLTLEDATFLTELHAAFGDRVGQFLSIEKRLSFPLKLSALKPANTPHLAVIGNAAQTMHPVAGQGFNVGMRDAWALAKQITSSVPADWGAADMLNTYHQARLRDTKRGLLFTDMLVQAFSNDLIGVSALRGTGLGMLEMLSPAKGFLVNKMSFGR